MHPTLRSLIPNCNEQEARIFLAEILARDFDPSEVEWLVEILPELDSPNNGHFASGDAEADAKQVAEIFADLEAGNPYAWFHCRVTAEWKGHTGVDTLGGCSYKNAEDFWQPGDGYATDMMRSALTQAAGEAGVALSKATTKAAVSAGMERTEPEVCDR